MTRTKQVNVDDSKRPNIPGMNRPNIGASKVQVTATDARGLTRTVPRDAQRLVTQQKSRSKSAQPKQHDVHEGGRWIPAVYGLIYDEVEAGDAVEMVKQACKAGCTRKHVCRTETESTTEVVAYVVSTGISGKGAHEGETFTKFLTVYDFEGAELRKIDKLEAELKARKAALAAK